MRRMMAMRAAAGLVLALAASGARAEDVNEAVAPFIDDQTLLVGHADVGAIDTAAVETYAGDLLTSLKVEGLDAIKQQIAQNRKEGDAVLARFKGLGGRHLFWVLNHGDIFPSPDPRNILVPVPAEKAADMMALIKESLEKDEVVEALTPTMLFYGSPQGLARLRALKPSPRPELHLATGSDAPPVEVVGAMTADMHRVLSEIVPTLPPELGGGSAEGLLSVKRISVQLRLPPKPSVTARAYFAQEADARGTVQVAEKARDVILGDPGFNRELAQPDMKPVAGDVRDLVKGVLTPAVEKAGTEWEVRMTLDDARVQQAAKLLSPALGKARTQAKHVQSMSNMRQILMGLIIYANDHQNALPETLTPAIELAKIPEKMLVSPVDGKKYIYRRWAPSLSQYGDAAGTPLVWEDLPANAPKVGVGFVDGHCEIMNRAEFDKMMAKTEAWAKQFGGGQLP